MHEVCFPPVALLDAKYNSFIMPNVYQRFLQGLIATISDLAVGPLWLMTRGRSQPNPRLEAVPSSSQSSRSSGRIPRQTRSSIKKPFPAPTPVSPIAITGGSRSISISIGEQTTAVDIPTEQQYQILSERLLPPTDLDSDFEVTTNVQDESWSPESLQMLGQELNRLREEVGVERWQKMTVLLPTVELPPGAVNKIVLALPNLKSLTWTGHRQQLQQWSLFNPPSPFSSVSSLPHLTSLTLHSEISTEDCGFLLSNATSVTHFEVHTLADVDSVLPKPRLSILLGKSTMANLETLILSSSRVSSVGPMLDHFNFPKLRKIAFDFSRNKPDFDYDFTTIEWRELKEVRLRCDMSTEASRTIRDRCGDGTVHSHEVTRSLASFRDTEAPAASSPRLRTGEELLRDFPFIAATIGIDRGDFPSLPASRMVRPGHGSAVVSLVQ
ncbi:hypothetical protein B0H34DRAFT_169310 [Crassisporium funariophilum]|nr:hypothetical protein B0H34DRAFT_169310 [Crassisporium funariophilum]